MDIQFLSTLAGLLSMGVTIVGVVVGGMYIGRNAAGKTANDAQLTAIAAMQAEINTLRGRTDDLRKENARQEVVIETICSALKTRGMIISIQGEMINIQDSNSGSVTMKIRGSTHNTTGEEAS